MTDVYAFILAVFIIAGVVAAATLMTGVVAVLIRSAINKLALWFHDHWDRVQGKPPWLPRMRTMSLLGACHGQHTTAFVSRHHLAEGGLNCPICETRVADAGDFSRVCRTMVDGRENECIVCTGEREVGDRVVACATILLASPDTEHGDHLGSDGQVDAKGEDPPAYYLFRRVGTEQALREKWGVEVKDDGAGDIVADKATAPADDRSKTADTARHAIKE